MQVGEVRVAEDADFEKLRQLCRCHDGWKQDYHKNGTTVWTKVNDVSDFKMIKSYMEKLSFFSGYILWEDARKSYEELQLNVAIRHGCMVASVCKDISAAVMYDVLHDPHYRKTWDNNMLEGYEICCLNPNNDVGYYALKAPKPLKPRDFVIQRSWLDIGKEYFIVNHSVNHAAMQPKKGYVRGISYITGYWILPTSGNVMKPGCQLFYVTQSDPKGGCHAIAVGDAIWVLPEELFSAEGAKCIGDQLANLLSADDPNANRSRQTYKSRLPAWAVNKLIQIFAPKVMGRIQKACRAYESWKAKHNPQLKPWLYPEQLTLPRLNPEDISSMHDQQSAESIDESEILESDIKPDELAAEDI